MAIDVTDATFQADVLDKSSTVPVVVDLWAPWCGPCRTLGPILEKAVDATEGQVVLAKVNVDENPQISAQFQVQSIPAVYALRDGRIVDGFLGAVPERDVERFVQTLLPTEAQTTLASLIEAGDELSLRQAIELDPGNEEAVIALASCSSPSSSSTRRSPCSNGSPSPNAPGRSPPPPGWASRRPARRRATTTTPSSPPCSRSSRTTTRLDSSTSTSSS